MGQKSLGRAGLCLADKVTTRKYQKGFASLPTVLTLMILIVATSVGITAISLNETFVSAGQNQSAQAYLNAEAGARDALLRIARNKGYNCPTTDCYAIEFTADGCDSNESCARIQVSTGAGTSGDPKIITSTGRVKNKIRKISVEVVYDASQNGQIASTAWSELTN